jgi:hypothetical protein
MSQSNEKKLFKKGGRLHPDQIQMISDYKALYHRMLEAEIPKDHIFDALLDEIDNCKHFFTTTLKKIISAEPKNRAGILAFEAMIESFTILEDYFREELKTYLYKLGKYNLHNLQFERAQTSELLEQFGYVNPFNIVNTSMQTFIWIKSKEEIERLYNLIDKRKFIKCSKKDFLKIFSGEKIRDSIKIYWLLTEADLAYFIDQLIGNDFLPANTPYHSIISKGKFFLNEMNKPIVNIKQAKYAYIDRNKFGESTSKQDIDLVINELKGVF